jgi:hypothetical protein
MLTFALRSAKWNQHSESTGGRRLASVFASIRLLLPTQVFANHHKLPSPPFASTPSLFDIAASESAGVVNYVDGVSPI